MADVANVEIVGLQSLLAQLDVKKYAGALTASLWACAEILKDGVATYPPESEANQPKPVGRWYVRGRGTVTATGRVYLTSQDLGHQWTIRVTGLTAEIGNAVTYGPFVQGLQQAWFHAARGWKTIYQVVTEKTPEVVKLLTTVVDRLLASPPGGKK